MNDWPIVPLGEIVTVVGGGTPTRSTASYYGGGIPWVTPKDMKSWEVAKTQVTITRAGLENSATRLVPANSILVVVRSGVLKHTVPIAIARVPVAINQDMKALLCGERVDAHFLSRFLKARSTVILQWVRATTADNFPIDKLKKLDVLLPPLTEQRRLAAILDQADALRLRRRTALAQLNSLTDSIFIEMFGDPAANPQGWPLLRLEETLTTPLRNGLSPSLKGKTSATVLTLGAITGNGFNEGARKLSTFDKTPPPNQTVDEADFLICRGNGNLDLVGKGHFPSRTMPDVTFPDTMIAARISPDRVERSFLQHIWNSPAVRKQVGSLARTTNGTYKVNQSAVEGISFIAPALSLQREFARRVNSVERLKTIQCTSLRELDALFASLQHRAFRGEL